MEPHKPTILSIITFINWRTWLPSRGNVLTLVIVIAMFWAQSAQALPWSNPSAAANSTNVWPYQGRLNNSGGTPLTAAVPMTFKLYSASSGGTALWQEQWVSVQVTGGLFNVMLGSLTAIPQSIVSGNSNLWLGITVGTDAEMTPRVQLGSVPFAGAVPNGSITTTKIADGAVTASKQAITTYYLEDNSYFSSTNKESVIVSNFSIAGVPAGDITVNCSFVALIPSGKKHNGTVKLTASTGEVSMPAHTISVNYGQYVLYGRFRDFGGGIFIFQITTEGEVDDYGISFGAWDGNNDYRFGRHCIVIAGQ